MDSIIKALVSCIPTLFGALIVIIPNMIDKFADKKISKEKKELQNKKELYVELISLFGKVIPNNDRKKEDVDLLKDRINLISIIANEEVVKALNEYIGTWSKSDGETQNEKYCELLKAIRLDLKVDKKLNDNFPDIGLVEINSVK